MRRRHLLFGLLATALAASSRAAQDAVRDLPRVVVVTIRDEAGFRTLKEGLVRGMLDLGHIEDRTYRLQILYGGGEQTRVAGLIRAAVAESPAVLIVSGLTNARRAREATASVPVVIALASDLVDAGIVDSLARPGGNLTGITDQADDLADKRLELLLELLPKAKRIALLNNPDFPATPKIERRVGEAAARRGVTVLPVLARDRASLAVAVESLGRLQADALLIGGDGLFAANARQVIEGAARQRVPVVHYWPGTAEMGALCSYHVDADKAYERAAHYVDRLLKGATPSDLPIERPARYELVVNRKVAHDLGIVVPPALALRADRIID